VIKRFFGLQYELCYIKSGPEAIIQKSN